MSNEIELAKFGRRGSAAQAAVDAMLNNAPEATQSVRFYAVAVKGADGVIQEVSGSFATFEEASRELSQLLGDDFYRDRDPFVATRLEEPWTLVQTQHVVRGGRVR